MTEQTQFENEIDEILTNIRNILIEKNKSYGDSALNPIRIFSTANAIEQIKVRIDDKLSRIGRGFEYQGENAVEDLLGYLVLYIIQYRRMRPISL